jgi:hypothetical protein
VKKSAPFLLAIGLASCSAPKATIVEEAPVESGPNIALTQSGIAQVSPKATKPALPIARNTGLRLPDMLGLPQDEQLRSAPGAPKDGKATVIARPPEE